MTSYYHMRGRKGYEEKREKKFYKKSVYTHKRVISVFVGIAQRVELFRARFE